MIKISDRDSLKNNYKFQFEIVFKSNLVVYENFMFHSFRSFISLKTIKHFS